MSELFDQDKLTPFEAERAQHPDPFTNLLEGLKELQTGPKTIRDIEYLGTQHFVEPDDMPLGTSHRWTAKSSDAAAQVSAMEDIVTKLVEPAIGTPVIAVTNHHCKQDGGRLIETIEEFSPIHVKGMITGVQFGITEFDEERSPANIAKHYRLCVVIGDTPIPLETFDGSWNKLIAITTPTLF